MRVRCEQRGLQRRFAPGDRLRCESEVLEKRRSANRPEMGIFKSRMAVFNQDDVMVMTFVSNGLVATRKR